MGYEITSDGVTVWVNSPEGCIGRFGRNGIDIHRTPDDQGRRGQCLFCTHTATSPEDWDLFVIKMKELHGIEVPTEYQPDRLRPAPN